LRIKAHFACEEVITEKKRCRKGKCAGRDDHYPGSPEDMVPEGSRDGGGDSEEEHARRRILVRALSIRQ